VLNADNRDGAKRGSPAYKRPKGFGAALSIYLMLVDPISISLALQGFLPGALIITTRTFPPLSSSACFTFYPLSAPSFSLLRSDDCEDGSPCWWKSHKMMASMSRNTCPRPLGDDGIAIFTRSGARESSKLRLRSLRLVDRLNSAAEDGNAHLAGRRRIHKSSSIRPEAALAALDEAALASSAAERAIRNHCGAAIRALALNLCPEAGPPSLSSLDHALRALADTSKAPSLPTSIIVAARILCVARELRRGARGPTLHPRRSS